MDFEETSEFQKQVMDFLREIYVQLTDTQSAMESALENASPSKYPNCQMKSDNDNLIPIYL